MMTSLLSAMIAQASASWRQEREVACADQRAVRANAAAPYCSRAAVVTVPRTARARYLHRREGGGPAGG